MTKARRRTSKYDISRIDTLASDLSQNLRGWKERTVFTEEQLLILESSYQQNNYPSQKMRIYISDVTALSLTQVKVWFQNRRIREKRLEEKRLQEDELTLAHITERLEGSSPRKKEEKDVIKKLLKTPLKTENAQLVALPEIITDELMKRHEYDGIEPSSKNSNNVSSNMVMLKNIPQILSSELLSVLARMGHGDEIVLADANFPTVSATRAAGGPELVRAYGHGCTAILKGVLQLLPLDNVDFPVVLMEPSDSHKARGVETPIWDEYKLAVNASEGRSVNVELVQWLPFYDRAKKAFAIVATGETALYGNVILKKGVL